jgi:hypothetical protein
MSVIKINYSVEMDPYELADCIIDDVGHAEWLVHEVHEMLVDERFPPHAVVRWLVENMDLEPVAASDLVISLLEEHHGKPRSNR